MMNDKIFIIFEIFIIFYNRDLRSKIFEYLAFEDSGNTAIIIVAKKYIINASICGRRGHYYIIWS